MIRPGTTQSPARTTFDNTGKLSQKPYCFEIDKKPLTLCYEQSHDNAIKTHSLSRFFGKDDYITSA